MAKILANVCEVCRNWGKNIIIQEYKIKFPGLGEKADSYWLCDEHAEALVKIQEAATATKLAMADGYLKRRGRSALPST